MCRPQCLLALFALSVGVAQSWGKFRNQLILDTCYFLLLHNWLNWKLFCDYYQSVLLLDVMRSFGVIVSIRCGIAWRHGAIARGPLVTYATRENPAGLRCRAILGHRQRLFTHIVVSGYLWDYWKSVRKLRLLNMPTVPYCLHNAYQCCTYFYYVFYCIKSSKKQM